MGNGKKALNARRWYTDNILIPILREANYDKNEWSTLAESIHKAKESRDHKLYYSCDNRSGPARSASRSSCASSFIGKVGFYQSLKPSEFQNSSNRAPRKHFPYLDTAEETKDGMMCNFLGYKEKDLISKEEYEASAAESTTSESRQFTRKERKTGQTKRKKSSNTCRTTKTKRGSAQACKGTKPKAKK
eukprot:gb/GECG01015532.1/.p1 GENE.gb/GECG01015532.1/~~gb/GECG01015532.1/.p1  ORF type:complete len:189 (+),score=20.81 gb/GECG01015532.1/:1-567(+)